jgi:hypothetical protein
MGNEAVQKQKGKANPLLRPIKDDPQGEEKH